VLRQHIQSLIQESAQQLARLCISHSLDLHPGQEQRHRGSQQAQRRLRAAEGGQSDQSSIITEIAAPAFQALVPPAAIQPERIA
jgi:hypothetical protein